MLLVHPKKMGHGKWEVAWQWLPHFLAADKDLIKSVDKKLSEEFKGTSLEDSEAVSQQMHNRLIDLIIEKYGIYGIGGLREFLEGYSCVHIYEDDDVVEES